MVLADCLTSESGIDDRPGFFGVEVLADFGGTDNVNEERGHELSLSLRSELRLDRLRDS